jgi:hypothetical protein
VACFSLPYMRSNLQSAECNQDRGIMSQTCAKILLAVIVAAFCLPDIILDCAAGEEPSISMAGGERILNLGKEQKEAIRGYNPAFQVRREADYLPSLVEEYLFSNHQLPYAVIGDFNGDGKRDVVLQGYDKSNELLIAVLSSNRSHLVMEIARSRLVDPKTEFYSMGDHNEYGMWVYLTFVPRGIVDSPFAKHPLKLSTDAFELNYFEKASVLYYLSGQTFQKYITGD